MECETLLNWRNKRENENDEDDDDDDDDRLAHSMPIFMLKKNCNSNIDFATMSFDSVYNYILC